MRRTLTDILSAIRADFVANLTMQEKYGLDPAKTFDEQFSKASWEAIQTYIQASAIWLYENIIADKADEIEAQIGAKYPFSVPWYHTAALAFQLGDQLVFDENTYQFSYPIVDESKQIVKYNQIRQRQIEGVTKLQVFTTKENKQALTADELAAFSSYISQIGAAGTHFQFISLAPDNLEINLQVYYDPQILKADGTKLSDGTNPVQLAVNDYLNGIIYAGAFNRTKLTDAVQTATGVKDVILGDVKVNGDLNNSREFESASGFYKAIPANIKVTYTAS